MRHVDDGTIHAWLDRQITDPVEAAWLETHLRECVPCRARLADEQVTMAQAQALLAAVEPGTESDRPAFETLVARAGRSEDAGAPAGHHSQSAFRWWKLTAAWAASVALAVAIGWTARDLLPRGGEGQLADAPASPLAVSRVESRPDQSTRIDRFDAATSAAAPRPDGAGGRGGRAAGSTDVQASRSPAATAPQDPRAVAPKAVTPVPPVNDVPSPTSDGGADRQARVDGSEPIPVPAAPLPEMGARIVRTGEPVMPSGVRVSAPPATFAGGQVGGVLVEGRSGSRPRAAAEPREVAPPALVDGLTLGVSRTLVSDAAWLTLPRTEAAARSGMPLYGIDGLLPARTLLSADARIVRTVYVLGSGETIEVIQERVFDSGGAAGKSQPAAAADVPPERVDARASWSVVRDGVRLTLRGAANPDALGERLRVE